MEKNENNLGHSENECAPKRINALSVISYVLLTLAIIFCAMIVIQLLTDGYVNIFGFSVFRVVTPSMEPEIPVGAIIISQKTGIESINVGDVISFRSLEPSMNGQIITHRVDQIKIIGGSISLVTRGDANNSVDAYYVTAENLVGKIVFSSGEGDLLTTAYEYITQKQVFFITIIFPMLIIAAILLKRGISSLSREISSIKQELAELEAKREQSNENKFDNSENNDEKWR